MKLTASQKQVLDSTFIGSVSILTMEVLRSGVLVIQIADINSIYSATYTIGKRGKVICHHRVV